MKYWDYCFYFDPEKKGKKKILEARGRIKTDASAINRRHAFVSDGELKIVGVNSNFAHNIRIQTMKNRNEDWSMMSYEDPHWEKDFKNDSFGGLYGNSLLIEVPYDTNIQDFFPLPGLDTFCISQIKFHF